MRWRKASASASNGMCVELATDGEQVFVRDSKDRAGATLALTPDTWRELLDAARTGELDGLL